MAKEIKFNIKAREELKKGVDALADAVKVTVLLDSIADFAAMNGVYATFFTENMPARVCYEVAKLPMGAKVEIDAILAK